MIVFDKKENFFYSTAAEKFYATEYVDLWEFFF